MQRIVVRLKSYYVFKQGMGHLTGMNSILHVCVALHLADTDHRPVTFRTSISSRVSLCVLGGWTIAMERARPLFRGTPRLE